MFAFPVGAVTYNWADLDNSCFSSYVFFKAINTNSTIVSVDASGFMFFVQNNKFLPYKTYKQAIKVDLDYDILEILGYGSTKIEDKKYIQDGSYSTKFEFDPYNQETKIIKVDVGKILQKNEFDFKLSFAGLYSVEYSISKNDNSYIKVDNPNDYDFRYIDIIFKKANQKTTNSYSLSVSEIEISVFKSSGYLVNPNSVGEIRVYTGYECNDDMASKIASALRPDFLSAQFSTSANTEKININLSDNPSYNYDFDSDGVINDVDNCIFQSNRDQKDSDFDLVGDVCDFDNETKNANEADRDKDGVGDRIDNCPFIYNPKQKDSNADKKGDLCADDDRDRRIGNVDNCVYVYNPDQKDINNNKVGDACEFDKDGDGVFDSIDNCININNPDQKDKDSDDIGDLCDNCEIYNPRQLDKNNNEIGDACEKAEIFKAENDKDFDTILDFSDNCPNISNLDQKDSDNDRVGDICDNCRDIQNKDQKDIDENGVGDLCDDSDNDNIVGYRDNCVYHSNADQADDDNDGIGDVCEDDDNDGILAAEDNCPKVANRDQRDDDGDGVGNKCDDKDDRYFESNTTFFKIFIVVVSMIFIALIFFMLNKMKQQNVPELGDNIKDTEDKEDKEE